MRSNQSWKPSDNRVGSALVFLESFGFAKPGRGRDKAQAFTFTELLVVLGVLALLALLAVPVLANGKSTSQRAVCASNLARIGRALAIWGVERGDLYPWQVDAVSGGTRNHPSGLNNNIWFQFSWV